MSKKLFASFTVAFALAATASVALADQVVAADQKMAILAVDQKLTMVADRRGNDTDVLDVQRANGRSGSMVLTARAGRAADLAIVSSDPRLFISRVMITYANGRSEMLRSAAGSAIELPERGRITSVRISYVNRGARGAVVKLIARDNDRDGRGRDGRGNDGRGDDRFDDGRGHDGRGDDGRGGHDGRGDDRFDDGRGNDGRGGHDGRGNDGRGNDGRGNDGRGGRVIR